VPVIQIHAKKRDADMQKAMTLARVCWNLALEPEKERDEEIAEMQPSFGMNDEEFEDFRLSIILPMIRRHQEIFPHMPQFGSANHSSAPPEPRAYAAASLRTKKHPGTRRNAPCPCNSGKKYKRCCGK